MFVNLLAGTAAALVTAVSPAVTAPAVAPPPVAPVAAVAPVPSQVSALGKLPSGQTLFSGDTIKSLGGRYKVIQQKEGNLVLYTADNHPVWTSPTDGNPGARAVMQKEGNLVIYGPTNRAVWATPTAGNPGAQLEVRDDGTLAVVGSNGSVLWTSH